MPAVEPAPRDKRFSHPEWSQWPYSALTQGFLLCEQFWDEATRNVRGVSADHEEAVNFCARQLLDMVAPSNFPATNPEILERTLHDAGTNLVRGYWNFLEELDAAGRGPPAGRRRGVQARQNDSRDTRQGDRPHANDGAYTV